MMDDDDAFDALADGHRRQVLVGLLDDDPRHVPELPAVARELAQADESLLRQYLSRSAEIEDVDDVLVRLHHVHLPKLADDGFVEWDRDAGVLTTGPRFEEIRPVLELLADYRDERSTPDLPVLSGE